MFSGYVWYDDFFFWCDIWIFMGVSLMFEFKLILNMVFCFLGCELFVNYGILLKNWGLVVEVILVWLWMVGSDDLVGGGGMLM